MFGKWQLSERLNGRNSSQFRHKLVLLHLEGGGEKAQNYYIRHTILYFVTIRELCSVHNFLKKSLLHLANWIMRLLNHLKQLPGILRCIHFSTQAVCVIQLEAGIEGADVEQLRICCDPGGHQFKSHLGN